YGRSGNSINQPRNSKVLSLGFSVSFFRKLASGLNLPSSFFTFLAKSITFESSKNFSRNSSSLLLSPDFTRLRQSRFILPGVGRFNSFHLPSLTPHSQYLTIAFR